jgi:hypothetical protein
MYMVDIFKEGSKMEAKWASFKTVGDKVQGTYIGKKKAVDSFNNEQIVYMLKQDDGTTMNVGVREKATRFHEKMDAINLGQIVGIQYTEDIPVKGHEKDRSPMKILSVFSKVGLMDKEWLAERKTMKALELGDPETGFTVDEAPQVPVIDEPFSSAPQNDQEKLHVISVLAQQKLGVTDPAMTKDKVMEVTGLAFIPSNLDKIIEMLKA